MVYLLDISEGKEGRWVLFTEIFKVMVRAGGTEHALLEPIAIAMCQPSRVDFNLFWQWKKFLSKFFIILVFVNLSEV